METNFPQVIAYYDPLMKVAAGSYKFGFGWVVSTVAIKAD